MQSELFDLIARLEATTEPSRELDARIWAEIDGRDVEREDDTGALCPRLLARRRVPPHDIAWLGSFVDGQFVDVNGWSPPIPRYSASIDDALLLAPKNWSWRAGNTPSGGFALLGTSLTEHYAATPAIALVIACLKAKKGAAET